MRATGSLRRAWLLRGLLGALVLAVAVPLVVAGRSVDTCSAARPAPPAAQPRPGIPAQQATEPSRVLDGVRAAVAASRGVVPRFGVAALDVRSGDGSAGHGIVGTASNARFYAASLAKLMVAVDVLDRGGREDARAVELIRRMLGPSDDEAMNELWVRFDGPGAIERVAGDLGLRGTLPPNDPSQWGETITTAADVARLYRHVLLDLPAAHRILLVNAISAAPDTATDGFDQSFGLLALPGARYAKQGWMYRIGDSLLHSAGVLHDRYVYVLLAQTDRSGDPATLTAPLDDVARAISGALVD